MASITTINSWLDDLAHSIIGSTSPLKKNQRRRLDTFRRRARAQSYARTNQFEVAERLTGMEEKFQLLSREELSDELYQRRLELRDFEHQWLPDVLDLLLRLSNNPFKNDKLLTLYPTDLRITTPPPITWKDLQEDDPVDLRDQLWRVPQFAGSSSDEDEDTEDTPSSSPYSLQKGVQRGQTDGQLANARPVLYVPRSVNMNTIAKYKSSQPHTEIDLVREVLFMIRGLSTATFSNNKSKDTVTTNLNINHVTSTVVDECVQRAVTVRNQINVIEKWTNLDSGADFVQVMKHHLNNYISRYYSFLDTIQSKITSPKSTEVVSILSIIDEAVNKAEDLTYLASFLKDCSHAHDICCLEQLYRNIGKFQLTYQTGQYEMFGALFISSMELYLKPIWLWIEAGVIDEKANSFPILRSENNSALDTLWQHGFSMAHSHAKRFGCFLNNFREQIFVCGKTTAFINHLLEHDRITHQNPGNLSDVLIGLRMIFEDPLIPFEAALEDLLGQQISKILLSRTEKLKNILNSSCGLLSTIDALDVVYLRSDGVAMDTIEAKIFARIDHCIDSWNDRFLVLDMMEEVFKSSTVDIDSVLVHAVFTSSRSMQSRRRSVKILGALAVEYVLPWPIANIIGKESIRTYQRISLTLQQIRRAKYILERVAYVHAGSTPVSEDATPDDQKYVQALTFALLQFVNTMYDHLTLGVSSPAMVTLRRNFRDALTFDEMIDIYHTYIDNLALSCLSAPKLKLVNEALMALLDMCIRFADLVSAGDTSQDQQNDSDVEASSFRSAQSRRRRRWLGQRGHGSAEQEYDNSEDDLDDDDDGIGEGYSSFIVLEEDTTVMKEIRKLRAQFLRQLDFFLAGLKGSGRGTVVADQFEILAQRLAWK